jgi:hypothetical protein
MNTLDILHEKIWDLIVMCNAIYKNTELTEVKTERLIATEEFLQSAYNMSKFKENS